MVLQRVIKPKTQRAKRRLEDREPKIFENTKFCIFLKARKIGTLRPCMTDLHKLKKAHSKVINKQEKFLGQFLPFEDITPLERISPLHDSSLFAYASHTKKRPNNLLIGRMYDYHILDMAEFGIENYKGFDDFKNAKFAVDTKPCMVFCGSEFEDFPDYKRMKSLLIDFFRGVEARDVSLQGFEHALMFTSCDNKIYMRSYRILLKKSGTRIPRIELDEIGPCMDLVIRRTKFASADLIKRACRQPKMLLDNKVKNISKDVFGTKLGRIHMTKQDLNQLQTRKLKALKKTKGDKEDSMPVENGTSNMETESAPE